ncbi:protein ADM2 isoform X1 [Pleurodeles waltl]|uniref:protein ADM2 isoform X1 n=1 Tax=Pleurodeles waltl TaxID=8319 RepID=UPI00370987ED
MSHKLCFSSRSARAPAGFLPSRIRTLSGLPMKAPLPPAALGYISLLCLLHLSMCRALPMHSGREDLPPESRKPPDRHLLDPDDKVGLLNRILAEAKSSFSSSGTKKDAVTDLPGARKRSPGAIVRNGLFLRRSPSSAHHADQARPRLKRHAHFRGHRPQLMRVGCSLGTCQVQNLSHRLWQLVGQSGREDTSPINPNSPHSYG